MLCVMSYWWVNSGVTPPGKSCRHLLSLAANYEILNKPCDFSINIAAYLKSCVNMNGFLARCRQCLWYISVVLVTSPSCHLVFIDKSHITLKSRTQYNEQHLRQDPSDFLQVKKSKHALYIRYHLINQLLESRENDEACDTKRKFHKNYLMVMVMICWTYYDIPRWLVGCWMIYLSDWLDLVWYALLIGWA